MPSGVSDADSARAQAALDDASALIRAEAGITWVNDDDELTDVPDILVTLTCKAAQRVIVNPDGQSQSQTGPFGGAWANASSDVYLTKYEKNLVRRAAGRTGLSSVRVEAPAEAAGKRRTDDDYSEDEDEIPIF